jgi:hypothetical protein
MSDLPSKSDFGIWLAMAQAGDSITYARATPLSNPSRELMREAMKASYAGLVALVQRRNPEDNSFSYIAQRAVRGHAPEAKPSKPCRTPNCDRPIPPHGKIGLCRQCSTNAARRRRREGAE